MHLNSIGSLSISGWLIVVALVVLAPPLALAFVQKLGFYSWYPVVLLSALFLSLTITQYKLLYFYVFVVGLLTALAEIIGKFSDEPIKSLSTPHAVIYHVLNGSIAALALKFLIISGTHVQAPLDRVKAVLAAGLGSMLIMRSKLFNLKVGSEDVSFGPDQIVKVFLDYMERAIDRVRARSRLQFVMNRMKDRSFDVIYPYTQALLDASQVLDIAERQKLRDAIVSIKTNDPADPELKSYRLGFLLLNEMGEDFLGEFCRDLPVTSRTRAPIGSREESWLERAIPSFLRQKEELVPYFAYGPNMSASDMCRRLGHTDAEVQNFKDWSKPTKAVLKGYRRTFSKPAPDDPGRQGLANLERDESSVTEGVLYELSTDFIDFLDLHEDGYFREQVEVEVNGTRTKAQTYVASAPRENLKPAKAHLDIIRNAAKEYGFSANTQHDLGAVETLPEIQAPPSIGNPVPETTAAIYPVDSTGTVSPSEHSNGESPSVTTVRPPSN